MTSINTTINYLHKFQKIKTISNLIENVQDKNIWIIFLDLNLYVICFQSNQIWLSNVMQSRLSYTTHKAKSWCTTYGSIFLSIIVFYYLFMHICIHGKPMKYKYIFCSIHVYFQEKFSYYSKFNCMLFEDLSIVNICAKLYEN